MIMNESDSQVEADKGLCADNFFRIQFLCLLYKYLYHFVFVQYAVKLDIHANMCIVCKCMANMGSLNSHGIFKHMQLLQDDKLVLAKESHHPYGIN